METISTFILQKHRSLSYLTALSQCDKTKENSETLLSQNPTLDLRQK